MNKNDVKLICLIIAVSILLLIFLKINTVDSAIAKVYYENEVILTIDLNIDNNYIVDGANGKIEILVKDKKIRVVSENSPLHICSEQGWISKSNESIICLPNRVIIKMESSNNVDTIVR